MNRRIFSIIIAIVGIVAIIFGIICLCSDSGGYESNEIYGGDAYTGIQNASAQTARNVRVLGNIVKMGFGFVLIVSGLVLAGFGTCGLIYEKQAHIETAGGKTAENLFEIRNKKE
ncbi:MAG: hypothetical protein IKI49_05845 [Oscillospiraceae bacterium]|nr:hypothetical protein [Oscillospiraceae bacterium]